MPFSVTLQCSGSDADLLAAELQDSGTLGVIEEDRPGGLRQLRVFFGDEERAAAFAGRLAACHPVMERNEARDWVEEARALWKPVPAGERFFLSPAWRDDPAPSGRLRLEMPPGNAYGTGLHAPTQLMLAALERSLRPGDAVLDLGAGSGVLSAAALLLDAGVVIACDIEEDAVRAAREYTLWRVPLFLGSARGVRAAAVDIVAANINAATIVTLVPEIARILKPGGRALLGGFTTAEVGRLTGPLEAASLQVIGRMDQEDWACLIVSPQV